MRIGIFTDTYTPDINGVVSSVVTLQNGLEQAGHEVYIITGQNLFIWMSFMCSRNLRSAFSAGSWRIICIFPLFIHIIHCMRIIRIM